MAMDTHGTLVAFGMALMLLWQVVALLLGAHRCRRVWSLGGLWKDAKHIARRLAARQDNIDSRERLINALIRQKVDEVCVDRLKGCAQLARFGMFFTYCFILWNLFTEKQRWLTFWQDAVLIFAGAMFLGMSTCECIVQAKTLHAWYAAFMIVATGFMMGAPHSPMWWRTSLTIAWLVRLVASLAYLRLPWILVWNVVYVIGSLYSSRWYVSLWEELLLDTQRLAVMECAALAILLGVCASASWVAFSRARRDVETMALQDETNALTTLLNWVCEVMVDLDSELRICEEAPRLAAMLMLGSGRQNLKGTLLQDFMPLDEDRTKFEQQVLAHGECESSAVGAMHVKLYDSLNNHISVEIFYVHYLDMDRRKRLRLGIREFGDSTTVSELRGFENQPQPRRVKRKQVFRGTQPLTVGRPLQDDSANMCVEVSSASSDDDEGKSAPGDPGRSRSVSSASMGEDRATAARGLAVDMPVATTHKAKAIMISQAMSMWHSPPAPGACCEFHKGVAQVQEVAGQMERYTCANGVDVRYDAQCTKCGVFAAWDDRRSSSSRSRMQTCGVCFKQKVVRVQAAGETN